MRQPVARMRIHILSTLASVRETLGRAARHPRDAARARQTRGRTAERPSRHGTYARDENLARDLKI